MRGIRRSLWLLAVPAVLFAAAACTSVPDFDSAQTRDVFLRAMERAVPPGYVASDRILAYRYAEKAAGTDKKFCILTFPQNPSEVMSVRYVQGTVVTVEYLLQKDGTLRKEEDGKPGTATPQELSSVKFTAAFLTGKPASEIAEQAVRKEDHRLLLKRNGTPERILLTVDKISGLPEKLEYEDSGMTVELHQVMVKHGLLSPGRVISQCGTYVREEMTLLSDEDAGKLMMSIHKKK